MSPATVVGWVQSEGLNSTPGSRYEYSNTDNIVLGLIAKRRPASRTTASLRQIVFGPAKLRQTTLPTTIALPTPFIHGYVVAPGAKRTDVSTFISRSGAWASGGIVSTPADLNTFMRNYLAGTFFDSAQQRAQRQFVAGHPVHPGPG